MVGSQRSVEQRTPIDTECINIDGDLEDMLRFDADATAADESLSNGAVGDANEDDKMDCDEKVIVDPTIQPFGDEASFDEALRNVYPYNIDVDVIRDSNLVPDMLQLHLSSNIKDTPFNVEGIQMLAAELEGTGFSEIAITEHIVPLLIKADLSSELATCLRKYTNISEKCLVAALVYFVEKRRSCTSEEEKATADTNLNATLSCSFEEETIREPLRVGLKFDDALELLEHLYEALKSEDCQLEERPQNGDSFDDDQLLMKWFTVIIDAHFHQFVISRDPELIKSLKKYRELIDGFVADIREMKTLEAMVMNVINGKTTRSEQYGSKWYSIEQIKL